MYGQQSFSLREEARQTSRRSRAHWTPESRLRKNPVAFTSSGAKDPFQDGERPVETDHATENGMTERKSPQPPQNATPSASEPQAFTSTTPQTSYSRPPDSDARETPSEAERQEIAAPSREYRGKPRSPSPTSSYCSDEEVILFRGRNKGREKSCPPKTPATEKTQDHEGQEHEGKVETITSGRTPPPPGDEPPSSLGEASNDSDEGDGTTSDYLANLLASGEQLTAEKFHFRELGASDDEICFSQSDAISGSISLDSDLDIGPDVSWSTSRKKKRVGKHALKGLQSRKKGLKQPKPHDLFSRYPSGMTMDQVVEELERFLLSSEEQLSFPPLSKPFRKMLHEMAGRLHLKSKSIGKGDTRRPVLYRTKATPLFNTGSFEAVTSKITRRFWGPRSKPGMKRPQAGGGGFAGYRDGEVVGSGLPELSSENRGRAMLEKMGWSTGMALGTDNNKGILQPVSQVVKRTKAGLG